MTSPSDAPEGGFRHAEWELPEVLAAVIMVALVIVSLTALVAGIVVAASTSTSGLSSAEAVGEAMQSATGWANPAYAFVLVAGVALVWWQARIWSGEIDLAVATDAEDADPDVADSPVLVAAFDHLLRAKSLATWALPLLLVVLTASAASVVASFLVFRGNLGGSGGEVWSNHVETIGFAAATWVLVLAGLVAALYVRTQVSYEFTVAEQAAGSATASPPLPAPAAGARAGDEDDDGDAGAPSGAAWAPDDDD